MKYTLLAIPFTTLALLTGCGGSSSGGDNAAVVTPTPTPTPTPAPTPAPTVTVTAPANAGFEAFEVSWDSTDANSCTSTDLSGVSATSGAINVSGQSAGSHTYTVTCTGDGGSASGSATTVIMPPPASASGTLSYSIDGVGDGSVGAIDATLTPSPNPPTFTNGGASWIIAPSTLDVAGTPAFSGSFVFAPYSIQVAINLPPPLNADITLSVPGKILTVVPGNGTAVLDSSDVNHPTLKITGITFQDDSTTPQSCSSANPLFCDYVPGSGTATTGDVTITYDDSTMTSYTGVARTFQQIPALLADPSLPCLHDTPDGSPVPPPADPNNDPATSNPCANAVLTFTGSTL